MCLINGLIHNIMVYSLQVKLNDSRLYTFVFCDVDTYHSILRWELTLLSTYFIFVPPKRKNTYL